MADGDGLRARIAALPQPFSSAGPTCPVCWPGVAISREDADLHREWHALRDAWLRAHAVLNQTGLPTDTKALDAARFALADFEVHQHPGF